VKSISNKIKDLGYSRVIRGDGGITLFLKEYNNRLLYGASITKLPKEVSLAIGIFDAEILKMMSKVEGWEEHNLNIVDFTYKNLIQLEDGNTVDKDKAEGCLEELESELNNLDKNMDKIANEYLNSLSEYNVPNAFSSRLLPQNGLIGLYYGLLNKLVIGQGEKGELQEIVQQNISKKQPNAPVNFKIDLVIKYSKSRLLLTK